MKTLWNIDHQAAVLRADERGVMPGESHEFTEREIKAGLTGSWSEVDPRRGLAEERAFKQARDAVPEISEISEISEPAPAESGDKKEEMP